MALAIPLQLQQLTVVEHHLPLLHLTASPQPLFLKHQQYLLQMLEQVVPITTAQQLLLQVEEQQAEVL
jgi:hypothetical protein